MWLVSLITGVVAATVAFMLGQYLFEPNRLPIVEGFFQPEFMNVAYTLRRSMESGLERGAAFAVYHDGELVVDMWAGYADRESMRRWRNETTTLTFGCTKGVSAFIVALMVDRGLLNYSEPVATYWPEFRQNGKQDITLEMLLNHQAGFPYLSQEFSLRDLEMSSEGVEDIVLAENPLWTPGTEVGYHDWTFGLILDRLIQKVDPQHRNIAQIFDEEIRNTLGIEYSMYLRKQDVHKTARIQTVSWARAMYQALTSSTYFCLYWKLLLDPDSPVRRSLNVMKEGMQPVTVFNDPELREIPMSSISGTGTARGLAKLFSVLANGGRFEGNKILKPEIVNKMLNSDSEQTCKVTGLPMSFSQGMQIFRNPYGEVVVGQAGRGGQVVVADPTNRLAIAYLTNYLSIYQNGEDPRFLAVQKAVYSGLQEYIDRKQRMAGT